MNNCLQILIVVVLASIAAPAWAKRGDFILGNNERDVASYARDGFNVYVGRTDLTRLATCDSAELGFKLTDPDALALIEAHRKSLAREVEAAERNGLDLCLGDGRGEIPRTTVCPPAQDRVMA